MKNIICRLFGHKTDKRYNDSGWDLCTRCSEHEYYNDWTNRDRVGIIRFPIRRLRSRIENRIYNWKAKRKGFPF